MMHTDEETEARISIYIWFVEEISTFQVVYLTSLNWSWSWSLMVISLFPPGAMARSDTNTDKNNNDIQIQLCIIHKYK